MAIGNKHFIQIIGAQEKLREKDANDSCGTDGMDSIDQEIVC